MTESIAHKTKEKKENPFINILFNIVIPIVVLNQLTRRLGDEGPVIALIVALAFPIVYGIYDYIQRKKKNALSALGIINVLFTGGLALFQLEGIWFAVKEAAFPLIIGIAVYISAFTRKPFIEFIAYNDSVLNRQLIKERLEARNLNQDFHLHLRKSTKLVAISFFLSSVLNYALARYIFIDIDPSLVSSERSAILNDQIAKMTGLSVFVIVIPLMIFMAFVMWHLLGGIKKMTGLPLNDILPDPNKT